MIAPSDHVKRFASAKTRFFKSMLSAFFDREFPKLFGPLMREKIADELMTLFEAHMPERQHLMHGQMLWNALDKRTRADAPNPRYVPVILSVITKDDVDELTNGTPMNTIAGRAIARMTEEAYEQGGVLSSRDLGLLRLRHPAWASKTRRTYEAEHERVLPHTGALHDMGSTISHKVMIVKKVIIEKKDPAIAAQECAHSQTSVDRYLKDYHRVKTLSQCGYDIEFIHLTTEIAKHVIKQYFEIIHDELQQT